MASSLFVITAILAVAGSALAQSPTECTTMTGDRCGTFDPTAVCQCNMACVFFGDCCDDVTDCFDISPPSPPMPPTPPAPPLPPPSSSPLILTELADPDNNADARYVEIFNLGCTPVVLDDAWALRRFTNGNTSPQNPVPLTGTIPPRSTFIVATDGDEFLSVYGFAADQDIGANGPADSNGDDNIQLLFNGDVVDTFGVPGQDGTGTAHEFEDGRAERLPVMAAQPVWIESEWIVASDSNSFGPQTAPSDYDPGVWAGASSLPPCMTAMTVSDPHMNGFRGQSFDFTGEPNSIYALISDHLLAVNAEFATAYTTGASTDSVTLESRPMFASGTWMSAIGFVFGGSADQMNTLQVSVKPAPERDLECPGEMGHSACFYGGSVHINGESVMRLGEHNIVESAGFTARVNLQNSKSYGRLNFISTTFAAQVDYVPPASAWGPFSADEVATYAHLNLGVSHVALSRKAHGVLGQTQALTYDSNGEPVMKSDDPNGKGIIEGNPEDYVVASIFETSFKYSNY